MRTAEDTQELYDKHEYLIQATISRQGFGHAEFLELHGITLDDLVQHGRLGLHRACEEYDSNKNTSFRTFAISNIIWSINTESKKESLSKDTSWTFNTIDKVSFDSVTPDCEDDVATLHEIVEDSSVKDAFDTMNENRIIENIMNSVPSRAAKIINLKIQGYSNVKVAEILGVTHQNVSAILRSHKREIKRVLFA